MTFVMLIDVSEAKSTACVWNQSDRRSCVSSPGHI